MSVRNPAVRYRPLVRRIARTVHARLPANPDVELGDLEGYGSIGLLEAHERWSPAAGVRFSLYAYLRIRGAMFDALRKNDPLDWRTAQRWADTLALRDDLEQRLGRSATKDEIAHACGMTPDEYAELERDYHLGIRPASLEAPTAHRGDDVIGTFGESLVSPEADPALIVEQAQEFSRLVSRLTKREQRVLSMHYEHDLTYREIAGLLGVHWTRVDQIHKAALARLREGLTKETLC